MTDAPELLPCPFCGGEGEMVEAKEAGPQAYVICCKKCLCSSRVIFALMDAVANDLISAWNTRTNLIPAMLAEARAKGIREAAEIAREYDADSGCMDCADTANILRGILALLDQPAGDRHE